MTTEKTSAEESFLGLTGGGHLRNALLSVAGAAAAAFAALPAEALTTNVSSVAELVAAINSPDVTGGSILAATSAGCSSRDL